MLYEKCKQSKVLTSRPRSGIIKYISVCVHVCVCVCVCECNVVNATLSQRYLESTFLQRDIVCCDGVISRHSSIEVFIISLHEMVCYPILVY